MIDVNIIASTPEQRSRQPVDERYVSAYNLVAVLSGVLAVQATLYQQPEAPRFIPKKTEGLLEEWYRRNESLIDNFRHGMRDFERITEASGHPDYMHVKAGELADIEAVAIDAMHNVLQVDQYGAPTS